MKVLIWIGWFIVFTLLNAMLGAATGFQAGWLIFYAAWFGTSKACCRALDEKRDRKRLEKELEERRRNEPPRSFYTPPAPVAAGGSRSIPVSQTVSVSGTAAVTQMGSVPQTASQTVQRPADLPHYGLLEEQGSENGRTVLHYRLGTYDPAFARRCAQALLTQAQRVNGLVLIRETGESRMDPTGLDICSHPAFLGNMTGIRMELMEDIRELAVWLTPGTDHLKIVANPKISRDVLATRLDMAVRTALEN